MNIYKLFRKVLLIGVLLTGLGFLGIKLIGVQTDENMKIIRQLEKEFASEEKLPDFIKKVQFIGNMKLLAKGETSGIYLFEYKDDSELFQLVDQLPQAYLSYFEWQDYFKKWGYSGFEPKSYNHNSTIPFKGLWVPTDSNPFVDGLRHITPEDNFVYFGLVENKPAFFVTNTYIRTKNILPKYVGIIRSPFGLEDKFIEFFKLTNQRIVLGYPEDTSLITDISQTAIDTQAFYLTIEVKEKDDAAPFIQKFKIDRNFGLVTLEN